MIFNGLMVSGIVAFSWFYKEEKFLSVMMIILLYITMCLMNR